ncbi:uncharacterized protein [Cherax quadricarinatus]|uniref:uncharacterized protein n=1 Tax=Cherax quadricarinatus TaxID=27406 RepID=UPI00387EB385
MALLLVFWLTVAAGGTEAVLVPYILGDTTIMVDGSALGYNSPLLDHLRQGMPLRRGSAPTSGTPADDTVQRPEEAGDATLEQGQFQIWESPHRLDPQDYLTSTSDFLSTPDGKVGISIMPQHYTTGDQHMFGVATPPFNLAEAAGIHLNDDTSFANSPPFYYSVENPDISQVSQKIHHIVTALHSTAGGKPNDRAPIPHDEMLHYSTQQSDSSIDRPTAITNNEGFAGMSVMHMVPKDSGHHDALFANSGDYNPLLNSDPAPFPVPVGEAPLEPYDLQESADNSHGVNGFNEHWIHDSSQLPFYSETHDFSDDTLTNQQQSSPASSSLLVQEVSKKDTGQIEGHLKAPIDARLSGADRNAAQVAFQDASDPTVTTQVDENFHSDIVQKIVSDLINQRDTTTYPTDQQDTVTEKTEQQNTVTEITEKWNTIADLNNQREAVNGSTVNIFDSNNQQGVTDSVDKWHRVGEVTVQQETVTESSDQYETVTESSVKEETVTELSVKQNTITESSIQQEIVTDLSVEQETVTESSVEQETVTESLVLQMTLANTAGQEEDLTDTTVQQQITTDSNILLKHDITEQEATPPYGNRDEEEDTFTESQQPPTEQPLFIIPEEILALREEELKHHEKQDTLHGAIEQEDQLALNQAMAELFGILSNPNTNDSDKPEDGEHYDSQQAIGTTTVPLAVYTHESDQALLQHNGEYIKIDREDNEHSTPSVTHLEHEDASLKNNSTAKPLSTYEDGSDRWSESEQKPQTFNSNQHSISHHYTNPIFTDFPLTRGEPENAGTQHEVLEDGALHYSPGLLIPPPETQEQTSDLHGVSEESFLSRHEPPRPDDGLSTWFDRDPITIFDPLHSDKLGSGVNTGILSGSATSVINTGLFQGTTVSEINTGIHQNSVVSGTHQGTQSTTHPGIHQNSTHPGIHQNSTHPGIHQNSTHPGIHQNSTHPRIHQNSTHPGIHQNSTHPGTNTGLVQISTVPGINTGKPQASSNSEVIWIHINGTTPGTNTGAHHGNTVSWINTGISQGSTNSVPVIRVPEGKPVPGHTLPPLPGVQPTPGDTLPPLPGVQPTPGDTLPPLPDVQPTPGDTLPPLPGVQPTPGDTLPPLPGVQPTPGDTLPPLPDVQPTPGHTLPPLPNVQMEEDTGTDGGSVSTHGNIPGMIHNTDEDGEGESNSSNYNNSSSNSNTNTRRTNVTSIFEGAVFHSVEPSLIQKSSCRCGLRLTSKIVGGQPAEIEQFPWMAAFKLKSTGFIFCGGSIVSDLYVLTAAHCVKDRRAEEVIIRLGETTRSGTQAVEVPVQEILLHPRYSLTAVTHFDIALVKLQQPIEYNERILPVCLASGKHKYKNEQAYVAGWGRNRFGGSVEEGLQEARVRVLSTKECKHNSQYQNNEVHNKIICAAAEGKDACQGDSGGPLVALSGDQYTQIGLVSWGIGCADSNYPGIYTRISSFSKWITENAKEGRACQGSLFRTQVNQGVRNKVKNKNKAGVQKEEESEEGGIDKLIDSILKEPSDLSVVPSQGNPAPVGLPGIGTVLGPDVGVDGDQDDRNKKRKNVRRRNKNKNKRKNKRKKNKQTAGNILSAILNNSNNKNNKNRRKHNKDNKGDGNRINDKYKDQSEEVVNTEDEVKNKTRNNGNKRNKNKNRNKGNIRDGEEDVQVEDDIKQINNKMNVNRNKNTGNRRKNNKNKNNEEAGDRIKNNEEEKDDSGQLFDWTIIPEALKGISAIIKKEAMNND